METSTSPFAGLKRKRLPGMHMITALDAKVPLRDALAAYFFMSLHDQYAHTCYIRQVGAEVAAATQDAIHQAGSPEGMFLGGLFGSMASSGLALEEWSYLPVNEAFIFTLMADAAIEQTQRWINEGVQESRTIPLGPLVTRPEWAIQYFDTPHRVSRRQEARDYVERLRREIEQE